jgi:CPA2 family monovalent cation:H+ antiporter-2
MILSESDFSHQALSDVVPLRDIFGLLFFVTVGMLFDPAYLVSNAVKIAVVVTLIFAVKSLIIGLSTRAFGYVNLAPWIAGLGLSQIGEFSFVLARTGLSGNSLSKSTYDLALTCTVLTMALSPIVSSLALPIGRAWRRWRNSPQNMRPMELPKETLSGHVIVGGYGRSGKAATRVLRAAGIPFVVIELNHGLLSDIHADGLTGVWGDITSPEVLEAAQVGSARILLLTIPEQTTVHLSIERARQVQPALVVVARAVRERHVPELLSHGVNSVIQPEFEGGIEMVRQALVRYDFDDQKTGELVDNLRREFYSGAV